MTRYDFANDFSALSSARRVLELTQEDLDLRLEERAAEAYARGFSDAATLEQAATAARLAATFETLTTRLADLACSVEQRLSDQSAEAARLAIAFARKLAGAERAAHPLAPVEDAFRSLIGDLRSEREVAIAVHPDLAVEAGERLRDLAAEALAAFALKIVADPDIAPGDCRITWSDGGLTRDRAALESRLDQIIARRLPPEEPKP